MLLCKAKQIVMTKEIIRKSLRILEDGTSGVQVRDIEQVTI
jgi:hypothetical protein